MNPYWKHKTVESGDVFEDILYLCSASRTPGGKNKKTPEEKYNENLNQRIRDLGRLLNSNFGPADCFVRLSYSNDSYAKLRSGKPDGVSVSEYVYEPAEKEIVKLINRCRYHCEKNGIPFLCVYITSNMKGKTKHPVRIHHHLVVNREALKTLKRLWTNGYIQVQFLETYGLDYTVVAAYMLRQVPYRKGRKTYGRTNNLKKPIITDRILLDPNILLSPPEDSVLLKHGRNFQRFSKRKLKGS